MPVLTDTEDLGRTVQEFHPDDDAEDSRTAAP